MGPVRTVPLTDHVPVSHAAKDKSCVHRPERVDVTTRTSHNDGFITIGAGFIEYDSSLYPARTKRTIFNTGFYYWIQFNRTTSENPNIHVSSQDKEDSFTIFYNVKWNIFDYREAEVSRT